jgi:translation initiation factor 1 (eIF-1/SUI1)
LEYFDISLKDAAKFFKKTFSCGATEKKEEEGEPQCVEIQGDVRDRIFEYLIEEYKIPIEKLFTKEDKKEKKLYKN